MFLTAIYAIAALSAAPPAPAPTRTFQVEGRKFDGEDNLVCVLEGTWSDGESFVYSAWDRCSKMTISRIAPSKQDETVEQVHGKDRTFIIPAGSESFVIGNDYSTVQLFRNRDGVMEEILISD